MPYFHENIESCVAAGQGETFHDVVVVAAAASAVAAVVAVVVAAAVVVADAVVADDFVVSVFVFVVVTSVFYMPICSTTMTPEILDVPVYKLSLSILAISFGIHAVSSQFLI